MADIIFQKGGMSDLTIERARVLPSTIPIEINQKRHLTQSMNAKVVDYGSTMETFQISFQGLTRDNYDGVVNGLKTWFSNSNINWAKNSFTMRDENNEVFTVRFWQDDFDMPNEEGDVYSISLILKKE